jgi:hypothetical protein
MRENLPLEPGVQFEYETAPDITVSETTALLGMVGETLLPDPHKDVLFLTPLELHTLSRLFVTHPTIKELASPTIYESSLHTSIHAVENILSRLRKIFPGAITNQNLISTSKVVQNLRRLEMLFRLHFLLTLPLKLKLN